MSASAGSGTRGLGWPKTATRMFGAAPVAWPRRGGVPVAEQAGCRAVTRAVVAGALGIQSPCHGVPSGRPRLPPLWIRPLSGVISRKWRGDLSRSRSADGAEPVTLASHLMSRRSRNRCAQPSKKSSYSKPHRSTIRCRCSNSNIISRSTSSGSPLEERCHVLATPTGCIQVDCGLAYRFYWRRKGLPAE
jgi:hypothetical protein